MKNEPQAASPAAQQSSSPSSSAGGGPANKAIVQNVVLFVNLGSMIFMAATAALAIYQSNDVDDTGIIFVSMYMMIFSAILFIYEISQVLPFEGLEMIFKKNFGFLFGTIGKSIFTIL